MTERPTIFALSSGRLPAAIAVIRICGDRAGPALSALSGKLPAPRTAKLARIRDPQTREILDSALVLWFPGPATETGEDMAELHLHGAPTVASAVLRRLGEMPGLRLAEPGEFTRRAFLNGRIDLTAIEGLGDLMAAETEAQRAQAMRQLDGALAGRGEGWRTRIIELLAVVEAGIDFVDEEDVPADALARARAGAAGMADEIAGVLAQAPRGERLRDGLTVAIAGAPNVGKSSLLNQLARRDAAIVSPHAGTTRDPIEVHLDLDGWPLVLVDTAGIRSTNDPVELEGIARARRRAAAADLVLWLTEPEEAATPGAEFGAARVWTVVNKIDRVAARPSAATVGGHAAGAVLAVSALTGQGIDRLEASLAEFARETLAGGEPALVTRERQRGLLGETVDALQRAAVGSEIELVAEELRIAARALGRLTGFIDVEDVLDALFRDFCIGK